MSSLWSYVLAAAGMAGPAIAASHPRFGWSFAVVAQGPYIAYSLVTNQPGFAVAAAVSVVIYGRLLWRAGVAAPFRCAGCKGSLTA